MNIVVLAGGLSTERDVSLSSGSGVCAALRARGHRTILLDLFFGFAQDVDLDTVFNGDKFDLFLPEDAKIRSVEPDLDAIRAKRKGGTNGLFGPNVLEICKKADMVYMGLHGADGENGKVQAAFDLLGIRYTGSGYLGSALAMDKEMAKKIFVATGIPTPPGCCVTKNDRDLKKLPVRFPCVVKPCCGGSSVGVSIAHDAEEFEQSLTTGFFFEDRLLAEDYIVGREFSVGVLDGKSLPVIEIIPKTVFYDYRTKYQSDMATDVCPANLSDDLTQKMQDLARRVYLELRLETYARIDFLLDKDNQIYCLEANTLPGMTPFSLLPQEAKVSGMDYGTLCEKIIELSEKKYTK